MEQYLDDFYHKHGQGGQAADGAAPGREIWDTLLTEHECTSIYLTSLLLISQAHKVKFGYSSDRRMWERELE